MVSSIREREREEHEGDMKFSPALTDGVVIVVYIRFIHYVSCGLCGSFGFLRVFSVQ